MVLVFVSAKRFLRVEMVLEPSFSMLKNKTMSTMCWSVSGPAIALCLFACAMIRVVGFGEC